MSSGPVYHENCDCPLEDSAAWLREMNCPETFAQIHRDLVHFPTVDPEKIATEIPKRFGQRQSLCHYSLKDNKVQLLVCLGDVFLFWPCGYNLAT